MAFEWIFVPLVFLLASISLTGTNKAIHSQNRVKLKKAFKKRPTLYSYYFFQKRLFPNDEWENLTFLCSATNHICRLLYASTLFAFFTHMNSVSYKWDLIAIGVILAASLILDLIIRSIVPLAPRAALKVFTPFATIFLYLFSILTLPLLRLQTVIGERKQKKAPIREKILEFVHETELSNYLEPQDQKLITSIASFRERIAKEIMVPRIDIFTLSVDQTVHEAARKFMDEGYSRIPIYRDNVDSVIGVLNYKDVMSFYFDCVEKNDPSPLETPLETLLSPILYTPETKKISKLLQEFRKNKIHIAIVVDEYGGTEGIVTIEDILEELVGEIADEYDYDEETLFKALPGGGWIVDARMNLLDIEKELHTGIPRAPEYDTLGGFIYHKAGTIPEKGWRLHHDDFNLEVISSNERGIEKIWIFK